MMEEMPTLFDSDAAEYEYVQSTRKPMTPIELAERDLKKVTKSLENVKIRPNAPLSEVKNLEELVLLRREILEMLQSVNATDTNVGDK